MEVVRNGSIALALRWTWGRYMNRRSADAWSEALDGGRHIVSRGSSSSTRSPRLTSQQACQTSSPASHATAASNAIAGPATFSRSASYALVEEVDGLFASRPDPQTRLLGEQFSTSPRSPPSNC